MWTDIDKRYGIYSLQQYTFKIEASKRIQSLTNIMILKRKLSVNKLFFIYSETTETIQTTVLHLHGLYARQALNLESRESLLFTLLFPLLSPKRGADAKSHLLHVLASILISSILQTEKPLVIPIPAVISLVLGVKPRVTRSGANILHNLDGILLLVSELGSASENSLIELRHFDVYLS